MKIGSAGRILVVGDEGTLAEAITAALAPDYQVRCILTGSEAMLDDGWKWLYSAIGWYGPNFYMAYGDTDYIERVRMDTVSGPIGVLRSLLCVHLYKQSRRKAGTARQDRELEVQDARVFHRKWAGHPEVLARHPCPTWTDGP